MTSDKIAVKGNKVFLYTLLVTLALLWGLSFFGIKIALEDLQPIELLAVRWFMGLLLFALLIMFKVIKVDYRGKPVKYLFIAAAIQPCTYALLEAWGVKLTTSSESSIFIAVVPLMVVLEGWLVLKQKVSRRMILAICVAFSGVVVCIAFAPGFSTGSKFTGYLILLLTVIAGASYTHVSKHISKYFSSFEITFALELGGGLFFPILSFCKGYGLHPYETFFKGGNTTIALIYLGLGCSCLAYLIFNYTISRLPAAAVTCLQTNSITVVGVLAGIVLGGDPWGWYTVVGLLLTITGIVMSARESEQAELPAA